MKFTPHPARPPVDLSKLAAFAAGADSHEAGEGAVRVVVAPPTTVQVPAPSSNKSAKPEFKDLDDKRRIPAFVMRFTARELAMLKVIAETTPHSMHEFCLVAVRKALDNHFK